MIKIRKIIVSVAMEILIIAKMLTVKVWAYVPHAVCDMCCLRINNSLFISRIYLIV